jgi:SAM-dependent methyltransferase
MLVERALAMGYQAEGIEPSIYLQALAMAREIPVRRGVLPNDGLVGPYDVITLIDVIEHVSDPVALLENARDILAPAGVLVIVTPDVGSIAARVFGSRWWHYRVAHVGYFNRANLGGLYT